jgi:hypothetical protein
VDHPLPHHEALVRPWRLATLVATAVAVLELLLLVVVGGALIAKNAAATERKAPVKIEKRAAASTPTRADAAPERAARIPRHVVAKPALTRTKVSVLVLNGNGRQGAAAAAASRVRRHGYRIRAVANAPRTDYPRSLVMFRRGFEGEGVRLARDMGIGAVGPLDGIRAGQLSGAHAVVVVGT